MKKIVLYKTLFLISLLTGIYILGSCTKCYTCQAYVLDNRVDFNKECGSEQEKQQMETDFRKQYPDSLYRVTCN